MFIRSTLRPASAALRHPRPSSQSYTDCVKSIWSLHDETINIWTHLTAAFLFACAALQFVVNHKMSMSRESCAVLVYLLGATLCFCLSTLYHTFSSHEDAGFWQRMDHFGIAAFIWASSSTFSMLCFARHRATRYLYTTLSTLMAALCVLRLRKDAGHWAEISWARVGTHAAYGSFASLPALHCACNITSPSSRAQRQLLRSFWTLTAFTGIGGAIYATDLIKQIVSPGQGPVGASHQVMHVLAVAGAWLFKEGIHSFHASAILKRSKRIRQVTLQKARSALDKTSSEVRSVRPRRARR